MARSLRAIPIWLFHGADDPVIPVDEARRLDGELKKAGANVRYTEVSGVAHNVWDRAYGEAELWTWVFAQHR